MCDGIIDADAGVLGAIFGKMILSIQSFGGGGGTDSGTFEHY